MALCGSYLLCRGLLSLPLLASRRPLCFLFCLLVVLPPSKEELVAKMEAAGLSHASYTNYTAGVVAVHSGFKL